MKTSLLSMMILQPLVFFVAGGEIQKMKKYPDFITAKSGDNVNMNCTTNFPATPFSVLWTLDCDDPTLLSDHQLYKGRVIFEFSGRQITIHNVTERDSGMFCCHIETADGKRQAGNGTRLEVTKTFEGGEIQKMKKYPDFITAKSGDNVNMNCTTNFPATPFSVLWTLDCDDPTLLSDHQLYKGRVIFEFSGRQITIHNVTERDSGMFCCHIETADGKRQAGNGTRLEVTKTFEESSCKRDSLLLFMEVVRIILLTILIILLGIVIRKS